VISKRKTTMTMETTMDSACDNSVKIIPFCVPLSNRDSGVVGTITLRGQSAIVWFGWGDIEAGEATSAVKEVNGVLSVGNGKPPMGSLALSMPPVIRNGRPRLDGVPTTQLLGGSSEEDMILGHQISARLAKRVGWPIFVSCSFSGLGGDSGGGATGGQDAMAPPSAGFEDSLPQHAPALAEREVSRILLHEKSMIS